MVKKSNTPRRGRGATKSKAESFTGKKENTVDVRGGGIGDNSGLNLPPIEIDSGDFQLHLRAYKNAVEKKDTAVALVRGVKKAAAKVHKDLPDAIARAVTIERSNDPYAFKMQMEMLGIALKETGCPIQLTVFDTLAGDVDDQSYKRGFADGEAGRSATNKYPEGSSLAKQYTRGWMHGTGKNLGKTPEEVDAALADESDEAGRIGAGASAERQPEHVH